VADNGYHKAEYYQQNRKGAEVEDAARDWERRQIGGADPGSGSLVRVRHDPVVKKSPGDVNALG
jgi:hypothetical protein